MKKNIIVSMCLLIVLSLSFLLVGCTELDRQKLLADTSTVWSENSNKIANEKVSLKNVNVANLVTVQNLDIMVERTITKDKTNIKINTDNFELKINEDVASIIDTLLKALDLIGKVQVSDLELAFSKINIVFDCEVTENNIKGHLTINNVKNMFSANNTSPIEYDFDKTFSDSEWFNGFTKVASSHLVDYFTPIDTDKVKEGKEYSFSYNNEFIVGILKLVMTSFSSTVIGGDISIGKLFEQTFGTSDVDKITSENLALEQGKGKLEFSSKNDIDYVNTIDYNGKLKVMIDKEEIKKMMTTLSTALANEQLLEIYNLIDMIAVYDDILVGDFVLSANYEIK